MASLSTKELERLLRQNGCKLVTEGAKHEKWFSPITEKHLIVPRTLKGEGTLANILKDAGIPHPKHAKKK